MLIYIVRHAWAFNHGDPRWPDDSQRPLEEDGAERFGRMVDALAPCGFEPHVIATSPYVRCRQTADIIAAKLPTSPKVHELDALQPGSDFDALVRWSHKFVRNERLCWVGHAPDVSILAAELLGDISANVRFAKGAIASIRVREEIEAGAGELQWLVTAKVLGIEPAESGDDAPAS
jgi:phosphohistidine phosphatase